jgi:hypothetical protein
VLVGVVVDQQPQADLPQVVLALDNGGTVAYLLHCRQEQAKQRGDDGHHHEQLNQGKCPATRIANRHENSFPGRLLVFIDTKSR